MSQIFSAANLKASALSDDMNGALETKGEGVSVSEPPQPASPPASPALASAKATQPPPSPTNTVASTSLPGPTTTKTSPAPGAPATSSKPSARELVAGLSAKKSKSMAVSGRGPLVTAAAAVPTEDPDKARVVQWMDEADMLLQEHKGHQALKRYYPAHLLCKTHGWEPGGSLGCARAWVSWRARVLGCLVFVWLGSQGTTQCGQSTH